MRAIYLGMLSSTILFGVAVSRGAEEHCLVVQAIAVAGYDARMQLVIGTDKVFDAAYNTLQADSKKAYEKYRALFAARNEKGSEENPENHGRSFRSPVEREEYFRRWQNDMKALQADEHSEIAVYSDDFRRAMSVDPNPITKRRLARIYAQWKKEINAPCYWGEPR